MKVIKFSILLIFLVLLSSCDRRDSNIVIAEIRSNEELLLELREHFETEDITSVICKIGTMETYDCDQGSLRNTILKTNDNKILINIVGLDFPPSDECSGNDIAAAEINLGDLVPNQVYDIQISLLDEVKATGTIVKNSDKIKIAFPSEAEDNGIFLGATDIKSVPENALWGFIDEETVSDNATIVSFINELKGFGTSVESIGEFGHFEIEQTGAALVYDFEKSLTTIKTQGFAILFDGDIDLVREAVENSYCGNGERVRVFSVKGTEVSCD